MALSAARSLSRGKTAGAPLPQVDELEDLRSGQFKFKLRQSEMTMIAGMPGSQKSGFALWLTAKMNVPTLYFSADSSSYTVSTRLAAALTGETTDVIGQNLREGAEGYYESVLEEGLSRLRVCYDPNPSHDTIAGEIDAWVEAWDEYPRLIVVDNLMDVVGGGDNEFAAYKDVLLGLKTIARETEASIIVLHHMSESGTDPHTPAPRKAVMGKAVQTPENVLSIALAEDPNEFRVSVVKHRSGPTDPTGKKFERLRVDPAKNQFQRWPQAAWSPSGRWGE